MQLPTGLIRLQNHGTCPLEKTSPKPSAQRCRRSCAELRYPPDSPHVCIKNQALSWHELVHGNAVKPCQVTAAEDLAPESICHTENSLFSPGLWLRSNARKAPRLRFPYERANVRFCCWMLAPETRSKRRTARSSQGVWEPSPSPLLPACSNPTETHHIPGIPASPQSPSLPCFPSALLAPDSGRAPGLRQGGSGGGLGRAAASPAYPGAAF